MKHSRYSVVIIGSGIAGLYAALKISDMLKLPEGILLITKSTLENCNSYYAQGGIVGVLKENTDDDVEKHVSDTLKAGAGLSEEDIVRFISEKSDEIIKDLDKCGVEFDKNERGEYMLTLEAAHSVKRILHSGGDATGKGIEVALLKKVLEDPNIEIYENSMATELMINNESCCQGVIVFNKETRSLEAVHSPAVVLATGGMGQLYKYTTNPDVATGDGVALAYSAGAEIRDIEFVQFHPTTLVNKNSDERFLISEAVRGEGAKLVFEDGTRFMSKYDCREELAPRDIVTRAIFKEMEDNNLDNVYLDATKIGKEKLQKRFPTISKNCKNIGIDISKDYIPVAPAAHYSMGGVMTSIEGKTTISGLYAIGEAASTGLHGANRLASNSLLECVVCAYELANYLTFVNLSVPNLVDKAIFDEIQKFEEPCELFEGDLVELKQNLKDLMWKNVGIFRDEESLKFALSEIEKIKAQFPIQHRYESIEEYEFRNMLINAQLIAKAALERKESRGGHYRLDYVDKSARGKHSEIVKFEKEYSC